MRSLALLASTVITAATAAAQLRPAPCRDDCRPVRDLGEKFGIPTELTSYLVLEPGMAIPKELIGRASAIPGGPGADDGHNEFVAARMAAEQRAAKTLADAAAPSGTLRMARGDGAQGREAAMRQVGERTFVQPDSQWVDTRYRDSARRMTVKPFSPAYFALLERIPDLQAMFALGERVTAAGRSVVLILDAEGAEQLSVGDLANIVRDW